VCARCHSDRSRLALRHALSAKAKDGDLIVIESARLEAAKTKALGWPLLRASADHADHRRRRSFTTVRHRRRNIEQDVLPIQASRL